MHILNAFSKFVTRFGKDEGRRRRTYYEPSEVANRYTSLGGNNDNNANNPDEEAATRQQQQEGLSGEIDDFSNSWDALWICSGHAAIYYTFAIIFYSYVVEKWPIIDSMYFATVVFTTIGYGDLHPSNTGAQLFTIFLAVYGIVILGLFLGIIGEALVERNQKSFEEKRKEVKNNLIEALTKKDDDSNEVAEEAQIFLDETLWVDIRKIIILEAPIMGMVFAISLAVGYVEQWSVVSSLYWVVITGSTIGFGDYSPHTPSMRLAAVFLLPFAVAVMGEFLARIAAAYIDRKRKRTEKRFLSRSLTLYDIEAMDTDEDGKVDKQTFLIFMLVALQRVDQEDIDELGLLFNELDSTKDGYLDKEDILAKKWKENLQSYVGNKKKSS